MASKCIICLKCNHERSLQDSPNIPESTCPNCGAVYAKVEAAMALNFSKERRALKNTQSNLKIFRIFNFVLFAIMIALFLSVEDPNMDIKMAPALLIALYFPISFLL